MEWKKTRVTVTRHEAHGFRITETLALNGNPFTLESCYDPDHEPMTFVTLQAAKEHAELLNELALVNEDNARLRAELADLRDGENFEKQQLQAELTELRERLRDHQPGDDGRSIPGVRIAAM